MTKKKPDEVSKVLSDIQLTLAQELLAQIKTGTADAATMNVARQLLKDNNIQVSLKGKDRTALHLLKDRVPFPDTGTD